MASPRESKKAKITRDGKTYPSTLKNFPDELIEKIISHFQLKECTRAALLSKRFINSWKLNRNLCFVVNKQRFPRDAYASLVDRVLDQHWGPKVERLVLTFDPTGQENRVKGWIQTAVAKGVEELRLDFRGGHQPYPFSSDLIDATPIRALELNNCLVGFATELNGLRFLKTLVLKNVRLGNKFTETIFNSCLLLENLEFVNCNNDPRLRISAGYLKHFKSLKVEGFRNILSIFINAPTLKSLHYNGDICKFTFSCSFPSLDVATFDFRPNRMRQLDEVEQIIMSVSFCTDLTICSSILEGLSPRLKDFKYREFQFCLMRLRKLTLFLGGSSYRRRTTFVNPCDIVVFLMKCPLIEKIHIDLGDYPFEEGLFWKLIVKDSFEHCCPSFQLLKELRIGNFKFRELEFRLLKIIVDNAPSLAVVILNTCGNIMRTTEEKTLLEWMSKQNCRFEGFDIGILSLDDL
ncbi:putative FBD-associated F-box protein At1g61330 [Coffea eugenioides]|uniref:putative FBD-associated F-box protein At1g61330 n=1 Tax=Coffea eugenioides TaxID=49369 RepID=UPI000F605CCB|nr:putative FBD-associated F-box protein At1g61330 [Coffea eugenioides]